MKGFFSQCFVLLLDEQTSIDELSSIVSAKYKIVKQIKQNETWEMSGDSIIVEYLPECNGYISIDFVNKKWPDSMGSKEEPMLFGAWSTGHFGPFAYPNGLKRALEQSWQLNENEKNIDGYNSFIRIKLSYVFGAPPNATVLPNNYDALAELKYLNEVTRYLLSRLAGSIYFNPNGEVLLTKRVFDDSIKFSEENNLPSFDLWSNIRLYNLDNNWSFMDSVGNLQLDLPDIEVVIPANEYNLGDIDKFIRNVTLYLLNNGLIIKHGDTMEGPGGINWKAFHFENSRCDPPRNTIRWFPTNKLSFPSSVLPAENVTKKKSWKFWK